MHTIADPIINLGFKVKDNIIIISANNPSNIPRDICIANTISNTSSPTSYIFGIKALHLLKRVYLRDLCLKGARYKTRV